MILVDTSIWIDHLRSGSRNLELLLNNNQVLLHPFVLGELACGNLDRRTEVLALLGNLPAAPVATEAEVLYFIEQHRLMGKGIGYIDIHLLASMSLAKSGSLLTRDKRLGRIAAELALLPPTN